MIAGLKPYPVMKDSGVEWLGKIPGHWTEKRAKYFYREADERSTTGKEELLSVSHKTGVTPRKQSVTMFMAESTVGYKVCRPNDVAANTMWVFMGALGVSKQVGLVSPSYGVYRPIRPGDLLPKYVDRLLRVDGYKAEYMCRSTGINSSRLRLYPDDFLRIPFVCPPISEQAAIVRYLDHVDRRVRRLVRVKRKLIALLTEQKQAIIHRAVTRGLDPDVPLKDSGVEWLGEVPAHWGVARLRNVTASVTSGSRGWSSYAADNGPLFIRVANLSRMSLDLRFDDVVCLDLPETSEVARTRVRAGDLLLSITAYIGSVAVVPEQFEEAYVSQHVARCKLRDDAHNPRWLGYVLLSEVGKRHGKLSLYGGTKDGLSLDDVKNYPLLLPPRQEQEQLVAEIEEKVGYIDGVIVKANREINLLTEYQTRLTADVVTGKLDVRDAAAALPEIDRLAADDEPDTLDAESETGLEDRDVVAEEAL